MANVFGSAVEIPVGGAKRKKVDVPVIAEVNIVDIWNFQIIRKEVILKTNVGIKS